MTKDTIKKLILDPEKLHIIFIDPEFMDFEELSKLAQQVNAKGVFIPMCRPNEGTLHLSFANKEAIEEFLRLSS